MDNGDVKMTKTISLWQPWTIGYPQTIIGHALDLGCDTLCLKATDGPVQYGVNTWVKARWGGRTQHALANEIRAAGLGLSIWVVPYFWDWAAEADAIWQAVQIYNPSAVYLDIEVFPRKTWFRGTNVGSDGLIRNVSPFLRRLGRLPCPVYFQGHRRLDLHPEIKAETFLIARDADSRFLIDGLAPQFYPIDVTDPDWFVAEFERDLETQEAALAEVDRPDLPYLPTLPAFMQGGWSPPAEGVKMAATWLAETLGERLLGFNVWALDGLLKLPELYKAVAALEDPAGGVEPPPERVRFMDLSESERWALVQEGLQQLGILDEEGHLPANRA
jgi:hypothetical protein